MTEEEKPNRFKLGSDTKHFWAGFFVAVLLILPPAIYTAHFQKSYIDLMTDVVDLYREQSRVFGGVVLDGAQLNVQPDKPKVNDSIPVTDFMALIEFKGFVENGFINKEKIKQFCSPADNECYEYLIELSGNYVKLLGGQTE